MKSNIKQVLVAAGIVLAATAPVYATNFEFDSLNGGDVNVSISSDGGTTWTSTSAGTYSGYLGNANVGSNTAATGNTTVFCVDPLNAINYNQGYAANDTYSIVNTAGPVSGGYYQGGLASQIGADIAAPITPTAQVRSEEIAYLCNQFLNPTLTVPQQNATVDGNGAADAQIAIWDIFVGGGGDFGANSDPFQIENFGSGISTSGITADESAALSFVNNPANAGSTSLDDMVWIQSPQSNPSQNFAYYTSAPPEGPTGVIIPGVPEPGIGTFLWSMAAALGIMVFAKRRNSIAE
jgi:hypothetical protein